MDGETVDDHGFQSVWRRNQCGGMGSRTPQPWPPHNWSAQIRRASRRQRRGTLRLV